MKHLLYTTISIILFAANLMAENNAIQDYYAAGKLDDKGQTEQAYQLFIQAAKKATNEKLPQYVFFANYQAAFKAYRLSKHEACSEHATQALTCWKKNKSIAWAKKINTSTVRIELLGLLERGELRKLKISQAWNYNRQAISLWKSLGHNSGSDQLFNPELVSSLPLKLRIGGWRLIDREAFYLHLVGRSTEAIKLLEAAIASSAPDTQSSNVALKLYSRKLIGTLANIQSFVGFKAQALSNYEKEAKIILQSKKPNRYSYLVARINYLHTLLPIEGATEKTIEETNKILEEARKNKSFGLASFERMAIQILNSKTTSAERQATLESLARKNSKAGDAVEVFFTTRNALFEKAKRGEQGLDNAFNQFLIQTQQSGDKKAEPRIYRVYGDWLLSQSRFGEAIIVYQESLRMAEEFEWTPSVPKLLAKIGATYMASNQPDAAHRIWLKMEQYIASHPELPFEAILGARKIHCYALLKVGLIKEGKLVAKKALKYGEIKGATEYWLSVFRETYIDEYLKNREALSDQEFPQDDRSKGASFIHPIALNSLSSGSSGALASFYLVNRTSTPVSGSLTVRGHGVTLDDTTPNAPSFTCAINKPTNSITSNVTLQGGSMVQIPFTSSKLPQNTETATYTITWKPDQGDAKQVSWGIYPAGSKLTYAIMDSAICAPSPFIGVPVLHNVQFPKNTDQPHGFRVRSETVLRVEYRNPVTGKLVAVDNNGNGLFVDAGDFLANPENNPEKPIFPMIKPNKNTKFSSIEIWIYPKRNTPWDKEIPLHLELNHPQKGWTEYSQNIISNNTSLVNSFQQEFDRLWRTLK